MLREMRLQSGFPETQFRARFWIPIANGVPKDAISGRVIKEERDCKKRFGFGACQNERLRDAIAKGGHSLGTMNAECVPENVIS